LQTLETLLVVLDDDDVLELDDVPVVEELEVVVELLEAEVEPPPVVDDEEEDEDDDEDDDVEEVYTAPDPIMDVGAGETPVVVLEELEDEDDVPPVVELDEELLELELDVEVVVDAAGDGGGDGGAGVGTGGGVALMVLTSAFTVHPVRENAEGVEVRQPWVTTSRTLVVTFCPVSVTPLQTMSDGSKLHPIRRLWAIAMTAY